MATRSPHEGMAPGTTRGKVKNKATMDQVLDLLGRLKARDFGRDEVQRLIEFADVLILMGTGELTREMVNTVLPELINPYKDQRARRWVQALPERFVPAKPGEGLARVVRWLKHEGITDLDPSHVSDYAQKWPKFEQAHGFCVMPKPHLLGHRLGVEDPLANLGLLTERGPIAAIARQRSIKTSREGRMGSNYYELVASAKDAILELAELQPEGGFLVFPINTGDGFGDFSLTPLNACWEINHAKSPRRWPMPSYGGLWYVFVNPNRIQGKNHLGMDFVGDRLKLDPGRPFDCCSRLDFVVDELQFDYRWLNLPDGRFGSVFGFLP